MKYAIIKSTTEYSTLKEIAELLGYNTKKWDDVGTPFHPIIIVKGNNVNIKHGAKATEIVEKCKEEKLEFMEGTLNILKYLIINSKKIKK